MNWYIIWFITSFLLSLRWITNKFLHKKNINNKIIVLSRYLISTIIFSIIIFIYYRNIFS